MLSRVKKFSVATLALSLVLWGCDRIADPMQPHLTPTDAIHRLLSEASSSGYTVVKQKNLEGGTVSGTIGTNGGKLMLGKHVLEVPSGAVDASTVFTMEKVDGDHVYVSLTATRVTTNDIGSAGFLKPVTLTLNYEDVDPSSLPSDQSKLLIVWVKPDGSVEAQTSTVDTVGKRVRASLGHFSDYGIGVPREEGDEDVQ